MAVVYLLTSLMLINPSATLAIESLLEEDERIDTTLRELGIEQIEDPRCPPGLKGYFSPSAAGGKAGIVLCTNNHEARGELSHTQAHEMAHAAQYCLQARGLKLNDVFNVTDLIIADFRQFRESMREIYEMQSRDYKQRWENECAQNKIDNRAYCSDLKDLTNRKPAFTDPPFLTRADAGEKLSLKDILGSLELIEIAELYPPRDQYLELEARVFAYLGRDAALSAIIVACKDVKSKKK